MTSAEGASYARRYLQKAEEYLASGQDNYELERASPQPGRRDPRWHLHQGCDPHSPRRRHSYVVRKRWSTWQDE